MEEPPDPAEQPNRFSGRAYSRRRRRHEQPQEEAIQPSEVAVQPPEPATEQPLEEPDEQVPEATELPKPHVTNFSWDKDKKDVNFERRAVFDQEHLICCSAVATLEDCEIVYHIEQQCRPPGLSLQELVDEVPKRFPEECLPSEDNSKIQSCQAQTALKYVKEYGVCMKNDFQFKKRKTDETDPDDEPVPLRGKRMRIQDFENYEVEESDMDEETLEDYILESILKYPIIGEMELYPSFIRHRGNKIFRDPWQKPLPAESAHAVVIIGFGNDDGVEYYKIKNSHGKRWGRRGIGKVERSLFIRYAMPKQPYIVDN